MNQITWGQTLAQCEAPTPSNETQPGCLLQIYPLDVNRQLVDLQLPVTVLGRESTCNLMLPDGSVSRYHAKIQRSADGYRIEDLGSTNGTFVNETRVTSGPLQPGDRIQLGSFIFKFLCSNHIELQYHEAVYTMMTRDGLTGTLNKRSFMELLTREFQRALHRDIPLSLILFDLDHFKSVNDTYGHLAGDEVLQDVSKRITEVIAEHDVFARYGGEEFAILLPGVELTEASRVAERCRQTVAAAPCPTSAGSLPVTVSVGVADFAGLPDPQGPSTLIQAADAQLYAAKRQGRNRVSF